MLDKPFNPSRLSFARRRRGFTKRALAERVGMGLRSVTAYESGESVPSEDALAKLQECLGFPLDFFFGEDLEEPNPDIASFRALKRMNASLREMALTQGGLAIYLSKWFEKEFELPKCDIPNLGYERSPEAGAETLRRYWGIGELPIRNIVHLLESKGVRVFSLAVNAREVDAFSWWKGDTPFVFLNNKKSSERSRYDAAHELGHLVLHRDGPLRGQNVEREANVFAAAFLMPRTSVIAHSKRFPTLADIVKMKKIWNTSVSALTYRLHEVRMISEWQYRVLYMQIAKNGYLTKEPNEAPRETSLILPKVFEDLYSRGVTRSDVARLLAIPRAELEELLFGLAMAIIEGRGRKGTANAKRSPLTLVQKIG